MAVHSQGSCGSLILIMYMYMYMIKINDPMMSPLDIHVHVYTVYFMSCFLDMYICVYMYMG